jgi:hypothetical protein
MRTLETVLGVDAGQQRRVWCRRGVGDRLL